MTKNLKKLVRWGLADGGFTDDFNRDKYAQSWERFEKYVDKKERTMIFNSLFRPAFKAAYASEIKKYLAGGHKVNSQMRKEIKEYVKDKIKESVKAAIASATTPAQQSFKEQEEVLPEG